MKRVWALFKKELRTYFNSPIAYIVVTVLLVGIGYFFFQTFFLSGQATMRNFFRIAAWTFILFAPAITMKHFAEEKKSGTLEPLLTFPIKEWEAVLGKFLAAWALLAAYLLVTLAYPLTIAYFGKLDLGPVIGGYLGLFLLGGSFVALGLFASTITRNQVVSLIIAVALSLLLFVVDILLPFFPESLQSLVEFIGADSHFQNIGRGIIDTRDVVYSLSLIAFFLFLSVQVLRARMTDRSAKWRVNRLLYIGAAVGCVAALGVLSFHLYSRADLTQDRMFTLTNSSRTLVSGLNDHLLVKAYFSKNLPAPFNNHARFLRDELEEYRNYSKGMLSFEFIDPGMPGADGKPDPALDAEVTAAKVPKVEVNKIEKDQAQAVNVYMGVALYYQDKMETIPVLQNIDDLELELSTRIAKLTREKAPKLVFLTGHGELTNTEGMTKAIQSLGDKFDVAAVDLSKEKEGPGLAGADILVIAGPRKEIPEAQRFQIDQFLMDGGRVAFFIDRNDLDVRSFIGYPLEVGLTDQIRSYGVDIGSALVLDQLNQAVTMMRQQGGFRIQSQTPFPPFIRVRDLKQDSPLVKNLRDLTIPFASPLKITAKEGFDAQIIAKSSPKSWLFANEDSFIFEPQMLPTPTDQEMVPPQPLIVTLNGVFQSYFKGKDIPKKEDGEPAGGEAREQSPATRVAVVGSSYWASDNLNNRLGFVFFANLMDWLSQDDRLIDIRTRAIMNRPLENTTEPAKAFAKYGNMIGLPLLFALYGVVRWRLRLRWKRRVTY